MWGGRKWKRAEDWTWSSFRHPALREDCGVKIESPWTADKCNPNYVRIFACSLRPSDAALFYVQKRACGEASWKYRITTSSCKLARVQRLTQSTAFIDFWRPAFTRITTTPAMRKDSSC